MHNDRALAAFTAICVCCGIAILFRHPSDKSERASHPSPRTWWSSPDPEQRRAWHAQHSRLVAETASYEATGRKQLLLVGDSIFESLRGTSYGRHSKRSTGAAAVLESTLGARWPHPYVLAISGDQTQHVLWRLGQAEISAKMAKDPNLITALLIGTNNLGKGHTPEETASGVVAVARRILARTAGKLLVLGVLPRGDGPKVLLTLCPPRCHDGKPFSSFIPAVDRVNNKLRNAVSSLSPRNPGRIALADCGGVFRTRNATAGSEVNLTLMPDALHPSGAGWRELALCIERALLQLEAS